MVQKSAFYHQNKYFHQLNLTQQPLKKELENWLF